MHPLIERPHNPASSLAFNFILAIPADGGFWQITSGSCQMLDDQCVSDGYYRGYYTDNEYCEIQALRPLLVTATHFYTEECCDHLTVAGTPYSGHAGPQGRAVDSGAALVWYTDGSVTYEGFTVCAGSSFWRWGNRVACLLSNNAAAYVIWR